MEKKGKSTAKPAAKTAAKTGSKTSAKTGAKTGSKSGSKLGAKTGKTTGKKSGKKGGKSKTSSKSKVEAVPEPPKVRTFDTTSQDKIAVQSDPQNADFQSYLLAKGMMKESFFISQSIVFEIVSSVPKQMKSFQILSSSSFKMIVKPITVIFQRELKELREVDPITEEVKKLESTFTEEVSGFSIVPEKKTEMPEKPENSINASCDLEVRPVPKFKSSFSISDLSVEGKNKPVLDVDNSQGQGVKGKNKPVLDVDSSQGQGVKAKELKLSCQVSESQSIIIPRKVKNLSENSRLEPVHVTQFKGLQVEEESISKTIICPTIEIIQEFDLKARKTNTILTVFKEFLLFKKPQNELFFEERRPQKTLGVLKFAEEDISSKKKPPVIKILKTTLFTTIKKPVVDYFYSVKQYSENSQQTEKTNKELSPSDLKPAIEARDLVLPRPPPSKDNSLQTAAKIISISFGDSGLRRSELETIKKQVKEREIARLKRKNAAVKIQSWYRGTVIRKKVLPPILDFYNERLRQRKIQKIIRKIKRTWAPYTILSALRKWLQVKSKEKEDIYLKFQEYSAICIQRCYRGYRIRKQYLNQTKTVTQAKKKIRKLVRKWKLKKILATRKIQVTLKGLKDSIKLANEIKNDPAAKLLFNQLSGQLPILRSRFRSDLIVLYRNGKWVDLPVYKYDPTASVIEPEINESMQKSFMNRDEMPIRPLATTYDEISDPHKDSPETKKKVVKFLKKGGGKMSWKNGIEEKPVEQLEKSFNDELEESKYTGPPRDFLKRTSKAVKSQKVEWKAERRIDCWLSREPAQYTKEIEFELKPKQYLNILHLKELEEIFQQMNKDHETYQMFLDSEERSNFKIPVLFSSSKFISEFSDDTYQENIEKLEAYYSSLCSDEIVHSNLFNS